MFATFQSNYYDTIEGFLCQFFFSTYTFPFVGHVDILLLLPEETFELTENLL